MTSDNENYSPLKNDIRQLANTQDKHGKWRVFVLILSLILGAEVITTTFLLYGLSEEINLAQEEARAGEYPFHCLEKLADPEHQRSTLLDTQDIASCNLLIHEIKKRARKQLLSDIRDALFWQIAASNLKLPRLKKPVIHMGAEQEQSQLPDWLESDGENGIRRQMDNLRWENMNGLSVQQGMMGYHSDGEIVVHHEGLYFVYSQVYFELLPSVQKKPSQQYLQYIYKKTASYQEPIMLSKAVMTKCWNAKPDLQMFSSHQGALFHLQKGDRLLLQVSNIETVRMEEDSTFFGAFMIN